MPCPYKEFGEGWASCPGGASPAPTGNIGGKASLRLGRLNGDELGDDFEGAALDPAGADADFHEAGGRARRRGQFFERGAIDQCAFQGIAAGLDQRTDRCGPLGGVEELPRLGVEVARGGIREIVGGEPGVIGVLGGDFEEGGVGPENFVVAGLGAGAGFFAGLVGEQYRRP